MSSSTLDSNTAAPHLSGAPLWPAGGEAAALSPRAASSPCPDANNTKIDDSQGMQYNLLCGTSIVGSDLGPAAPADSLAHCLDLCTKTQGTCVGVTYNGTHCFRKDFVGPSAIKSGDDNNGSAVAVIPAPSTADCNSLGNNNNKHGFQIYCGQDYKPDDLSKVFAASMTQCIDACAAAAPQGTWSTGEAMIRARPSCCRPRRIAEFALRLLLRRLLLSPRWLLRPCRLSPTTLQSSTGTSAGTIAGAAVGGVAGLAVLCLLVFMFMRRRQRTATSSDNNDNDNDNNNNHHNGQQQQHYPQPPHPQFPYQQQQQTQPETVVQHSYYEVDASPRAVEVEAPMDWPTELADQSVWSNHEPKMMMRMK
ncbi:hypothetical protein PG994_005784 [Apiospora phragmitis]|uniref:Apple domain-containing protein n=1 Tax=Apiospora phragmitis TaxID=2905665 RepID=A0ABR1VH10_9PEZI